MSDTIFLVESKKYFFKYIKDDSIKLIYKDTNKIINIIKKIVYKFNLPLYNLFFGVWKKYIKDYNTVVILDTSYRRQIAKYIKKKNRNCKVIFYYWNIINKDCEYDVKNYKYLHERYIDEFWTFDKYDANKYNMKYNPQFYTKNINLNNKEKQYDIMFLGKPKNRKEKILKLKTEFEKKDLKLNFRIIEKGEKLVSYDKYLEMLSETKCILDYNQDGQTGLSLRPMEALFLEKKLITNNKEIKNYDFYNSNNIFILEEDNIEDIKEFMEKPYKKIDSKIIDYYNFEQWLNRFNIKEMEN